MFSFLKKIQDKIDVIVTLSSSLEEERLRLNHYIWLCLVMLCMGFLPLIYNVYIKNYELSMFILLASLLVATCLFLLQKTEQKNLLFLITNITFVSLLLYSIYYAEHDVSRLLWAYIYPLGVIFLFGSRIGALWSALLLIVILLIFIYVPHSNTVFPFIMQARFVITYTVVMSMTIWFENYRYRYFVESKKKEQELINEHRLLKEEIKRRIVIEQKLETLSSTDELTGIYNRRTFWSLAEKEINRASRYNTSLVLSVLDIDNFKHINDTYGHPFGDEVLKALALFCDDSLRDSDIFARIGGEEFSFLLINVSLEDAYLKMDLLRKELQKLAISDEKNSCTFTVSIGLAELSLELNSLELLYRYADEQMYESKRMGRNRVM